MTLSEAREILKPPLVFGNADQIRAVKVIATVEEIVARIQAEKTAIKLCPHCDGCGEHKCDCGDWHTCNECGGDGFTPSVKWAEDYPGDLLIEALKMLRAARPSESHTSQKPRCMRHPELMR